MAHPCGRLLAAGFRLNAPAGPDATAASPTGTSSHHQEHQLGLDDVGALRAELERVRAEHALAVAEAEHGRRPAEAEARHLRAELAARVEHIADLQQTIRALMPAPQRTELGPSVPEQVHGHPAGESEVGGRGAESVVAFLIPDMPEGGTRVVRCRPPVCGAGQAVGR
ncbi:hypothetical protein [Streptomyces californicus]|uniref:hypothetical protein n=1 Tax=Streptomyces californicus TaxID=67351 RepID=UPI00379EB66C